MERPHYSLDVWQIAMQLVTQVYEVTKQFPQHEQFALTNQIRRAAVSVPSNIAEGAARSTADFKRFCIIARGSLSEIETQLLIAENLGYLQTPEELKTASNQLYIKLNALIRSLNSKLK